MFKFPVILVSIFILFFSQQGYGVAYAESTEPTPITVALIGAALGAAGGAVCWYVLAMEDYDEEKGVTDEEAKKNRKELTYWVEGGALVGFVLGYSSGSKSNQYSIINVNSELNHNRFFMKFPKITYNPFMNKVGVNIMQIKFK